MASGGTEGSIRRSGAVEPGVGICGFDDEIAGRDPRELLVISARVFGWVRKSSRQGRSPGDLRRRTDSQKSGRLNNMAVTSAQGICESAPFEGAICERMGARSEVDAS